MAKVGQARRGQRAGPRPQAPGPRPQAPGPRPQESTEPSPRKRLPLPWLHGSRLPRQGLNRLSGRRSNPIDLDLAMSRLFAGDSAKYGNYDLIGDWTSVIPGLVSRCEVARAGDSGDRFELAIFHPISGLAAELWEHEIRALVSLAAFGHPALPEIADGGADDEFQLAFSRTALRGKPEPMRSAIERLRADPTEALREFDLLLDGLRRLHDSRILHRNICPSALRFLGEEQDAFGEVKTASRIVLTRFEMSTLVSNLVRSASVDASSDLDDLRHLYGGPDKKDAYHLAYVAPERIPFIFGDRHVPKERDTTDLYALGVLAFELFFDPLSELPAFATFASEPSTRSHEALRRELVARSATRRSSSGDHVPSALCELTSSLLQSDPGTRWNAHRAATFLEEHWGPIVGIWQLEEQESTHLLAFMPSESATTLYDQRQWIGSSPTEPTGRDELKRRLERELQRAEIVHSPRGATGWVRHSNAIRLAEAEWVLIGEQFVWFCAFLQLPEQEERVLVIKFLRERERARELVSLQPRRKLGPVTLFSWEPGQTVDHIVTDAPSWRPLVEQVRQRSTRTAADQRFLDSIDFLLQYQQLELDARQYAVTAIDTGTSTVVLQLAGERDRRRLHRDPLLAAFAGDPKRRPSISTFMANVDGEAEIVRLQVAPDSRGRPDWARSLFGVLEVSSLADPDVIQVRLGGASLQAGADYWVRPANDGAAYVALARQYRSRPGLEVFPTLTTKLRSPTSMHIGRQRWDGVDPDLKGDAPETVANILSRFPIHAVQGPPGTGKTTVAAEALRLFLTEETASRVLVSAQSNFALDNLGVRIVRTLRSAGIDAHVVREVTDSQDPDQLPELMRDHTLPHLTATTIASIGSGVATRLEAGGRGSLSARGRAVLMAWMNGLEENEVEIADRLRRSAAVVLATCSMAAARFTEAADSTGSFDWVIIEEAAKAWPTELVMPLLLGSKWTLIGDHKQLGAFRGDDVRRFLESIKDDPDDEVRIHADQAEQHLGVLELFRSMFENRPPGELEQLSTDQLKLQFRMNPAIAEPVSRAFYPVEPAKHDEIGPVGFLQSATRSDPSHPFFEPPFLEGHSLIWLDTSEDPRCGDQPFWHNDGEVELVGRIVERLSPRPAAPDSEGDASLAVLTPYRQQVRQLEGRLGQAGRVHTVHSFQGREADAVIVSLVRDQVRGDYPYQNLGHVNTDEVVNVLLSRAKRLCILVGSIRHFRDAGSQNWRTVCAAVERYGQVISSQELF